MLFMRSWRSTVIASVAIPTSIIASFTFMNAFGFTLNNVTMLALVLMVGVVIDDAIVVLENIQRRADLGEPPMLAALNGGNQVVFAVLATTAVLVAVFVPLIFLPGVIGRVFVELAITISGAVVLSAVVALTLSPMMASRIVVPNQKATGLSRWVHDRLDGTLPRAGELNPSLVANALGLEEREPVFAAPDLLVGRPPQLCDGCPHGDTYRALNEALEEYTKGRVFSDIGCYTLGALPPYNAINSCVDMGASITMAKGATDAGLTPAVAVIGDSTFSHSGMTGLLDAVNANAPVKVVIVDNQTTAMTGGQNSAATGQLEQIAVGLGVSRDHVRVITPLPRQHEVNVAVIREELDYEGVSVIIARRECIETAKRRRKSS